MIKTAQYLKEKANKIYSHIRLTPPIENNKPTNFLEQTSKPYSSIDSIKEQTTKQSINKDKLNNFDIKIGKMDYLRTGGKLILNGVKKVAPYVASIGLYTALTGDSVEIVNNVSNLFSGQESGLETIAQTETLNTDSGIEFHHTLPPETVTKTVTKTYILEEVKPEKKPGDLFSEWLPVMITAGTIGIVVLILGYFTSEHFKNFLEKKKERID